jgi:hypothetical protein
LRLGLIEVDTAAAIVAALRSTAQVTRPRPLRPNVRGVVSAHDRPIDISRQITAKSSTQHLPPI